jgi:hypothetical protein
VSRKGHIFTSQYFRGTFWNPEFFNLLFNFEGEGVSGKVGKSPVLALRPSRVKGSFSGRKYIIFDHLLRKGHKSTS